MKPSLKPKVQINVWGFWIYQEVDKRGYFIWFNEKNRIFNLN